MTRKEILERIYTEQQYYDCLKKDYEDRFTIMTSEQHLRRQQNIEMSRRTLQNLHIELEAHYVQSDEVLDIVEQLIFDTNKTFSNA